MKPILVFLSLLFCFVAQAQPTPVAAQKISYERHVPVSVLRLMPSSAQSCFWGTFRLKSDEPVYGIHLYNPDPKQGQKNEGFKSKNRFALEIFLMRRALSGRTSAKLINHLAIDYPSRIWGVSKYAVSWTWVEPRNKKIPVFRLDIWTPDGGYGAIGDNVFVSFPQELTGKCSVQSLTFGLWRASDYSGQSNQFVKAVDGQTEIYVTLFPSTGELTVEQKVESYQFALQWNKERAKFLPDEKAKRVIKQFTWMNSVIEKW